MNWSKSFLCIGLVGISGLLVAKSDFSLSWKEVERLESENLPASALKEVAKQQQKAQKKSSEGDLLLAFLHKSKNSLCLDENNATTLLVEGENLCLSLKSPQLRSLLHAILMNFYLSEYNRKHRQMLFTRGTDGKEGKSLQQKEANEYYEPIRYHIEEILKEKELLALSKNDDYLPILEKGNLFRHERPTLLDLLMGEIIEFYQNISWKNLANAAQGIAPMIWKDRQNDLYNELIKRNSSNPSLSFTYQMEKMVANDDWSGLDSLIERNKNKEYSLPAFIEKINHERYNGMEDKTSSLLSLVEKLLVQFKGASREKELKNIYEELTQPRFSLQIKEVYHPEDSIKLEMESYFLSSCRLSLYRKGEEKVKEERVFSTLCPLSSPRSCFQIPNFLQEGCYRLVVEFTEGNKPQAEETFVISRFAVGERRPSKECFQLFVLDRNTGKPLENSSVVMYSEKEGQPLAGDTFRVNDEGIAEVPYKGDYRLWRPVRKGDNHFPLCRLSSSYYTSSTSSTDREKGAIFTNKSLYRTGEKVCFKGLLWKQKERKTWALKGEKVVVTLLDANRKAVDTMECISNSFGSFSGEFTIPQGRLLGKWYLKIGSQFSTSFEVAEYKKPTFEIVWEENETDIGFDSLATFRGKVLDYTRIPRSGAKVVYTLTRRANRLYRWGWFPEPIEISKGTTQTDLNGEFSVSFTPKRADLSGHNYFTYVLHVDVTDRVGETQSSQSELSVGERNYLITSNLSQEINREKFKRIEIEVTNLNGFPLEKSLRCDIVEIIHENMPLERSPKGTRPMNTGDAPFKTDGAVLFSKGTIPFLQSLEYPLKKAKQGNYQLRVYEKEECVFTQDFLLFSPQERTMAIPQEDFFKALKTEFSQGKDAEILIGSKWNDVCVFQEIVVNGKVQELTHFTLNAEQKRVSIPYKKDYGEGIVVNFFFVREGKSFFHEVTLQKEQPKMNLSFQWETFRDKLAPNQKEEWKLKINTPDGKPVSAEVMVTMVDEAVEKLYPTKWQFTPLSKFYPSSFPLHFSTGYWEKYLSPYFPIHYEKFDLPLYDKVKHIEFENPSPVFLKSMKAVAAPTMAINESLDLSQEEEMRNGEEGDLPLSLLKDNIFFYPQLSTNGKGELSLQFTLPDVLTRWKVMLLAHDTSMRYVRIDTSLVVSKPLMVRPHLPRFLREEDSIVLTAKVINSSQKNETLQCLWEILLYDKSNRLLDRKEKTLPLTLKGDESEVIECPIKTIKGAYTMEVKVSTKGKHFTDGERNILPILPNNSSSDVILKRKVGETISSYSSVVASLPVLFTSSNDILSVANRLYSSAIIEKIMRENPEIGEQILSLPKEDEHASALDEGTPWVEDAERMQEQREALPQLLNEKHRKNLLTSLQEKLILSASNDGGWAWVEGMQRSSFITLEVLNRLSKLQKLNALPFEKELSTNIDKAVRWLDKTYLTTPTTLTKDLLTYLHIRTIFHAPKMQKEQQGNFDKCLKEIKTNWGKFSLEEKAMIATILMNNGEKRTALNICKSLREYATKDTFQGMFWANNVTKAHSPYQSLRIHTAILNALQEISPNKEEENALKLWLLRHKETQDWSEGESTTIAEICYALLLKKEIVTYKTQAKDTINRENSQDKELQIKREILRKESTSSGEGRETIVLTISAMRDMDYIKLIDDRDANTQPIEQLSGMHVQEGIPFYKEVSESQTRIFIEHLPKGTHKLVYDVYVTHQGECFSNTPRVMSLYN